ncbi:copia protein [Tanacetum coccineum]|uniref:Copia protein n=1 Tax=Tanacetum coccineum TaxID=301880 RepID=A0ABQ5GYG0_9ASTR
MPCSCDRKGMWDHRVSIGQTLNENLGNMMNEVDIENLTIEQYLMLTQEKQTQRMIRTESDRMPRTDDIHDPLGNKLNDYHLFTPQSHYETEEVSSDEDVDEWLNDILKTVVEECKSVYKKAQIRTPSSRTSKIQEVSFVSKEEGGDSSETLPYQQPSNEINPGRFTLPCTIGNLKIYVMADVGAGINMMPKSLFEHLKLANLKKTSMAIEMGNMTNKAPLGIVENILVKIDKFLFYSNFVVIDTLETILLGRPFLATIHAQIDVFRGEILLGVGNEKEELTSLRVNGYLVKAHKNHLCC